MTRVIHTVEFFIFYLRELILSNIKVAFDVLTIRHYMTPAFIRLPVADLNDRQLLALSNLISMTPGTLSLDVNEARTHLTIHCMYAPDPKRLVEDLKADYVRRVRRVF